jgi:phage shock protein C
MSVNDRLYRSVDDRVIAGVCAGLADRLDMDPALVRIGYAILALLTGIFPLLVLYVIMIVVVPEGTGWTGVRPVGPLSPDPQPSGSAPAEATPAAPGAVPGAVPGWIPPGGPGGPDSGSWRDQRRADRAARHAERAARRATRRDDPVPAIIGGLFLVGLGVFFLVRNTFDIDWAVVWPVAVIAFGAVILIAALRPRSG